MVTLQFLPYTEIERLSSIGRIRKLLNLAKEDRIVLLQGRLTRDEEAELIKATMEEIDEGFKGIELAVIHPEQQKLVGFQKLKYDVASLVLGDRQGLTIVGSASIVKDIKRNPNKIELLTKELRKPMNVARKKR